MNGFVGAVVVTVSLVSGITSYVLLEEANAEPGLSLLFFALPLLVASALRGWLVIQTKREWTAAADLLKLSFSSERPGRTLTGELDGLKVRVRSGASSRPGDLSPWMTDYTATGFIPRNLQMRRSHFATQRFSPRLDAPLVLTGDLEFDERIQAGGSDVEIAGYLDAETRRRVAPLIERGVRVENGTALISKYGVPRTAYEIFDQVDRVLRVARLFQREEPIHALLARNVREDPVPGVRLKNLELLLQSFRDTDLREICLDALESGVAQVIPTAAEFLGEDSLEPLTGLLGRAALPSSVRAVALDQLATHCDPTAVSEVLRQHLDDDDSEVRVAVLLASERHRFDIGRRGVCEKLDDDDELVRAAAARAVRQYLDRPTEDLLLRRLDSECDAVRYAIVDTLTVAGSLRAVERLLPFAERDVQCDRDLSKAAAVAIEQIQSRAGDVDHGSLALADDDDDEAGGLALADDQTGRLSDAGPEPDP